MLERLLTIGKRVLAESEIDRVLTTALDGMIDISGAERGMILLFDRENGEPTFEEARNLDRQDIARPEFEISRTIVAKVRAEGRAYWSPNVLDDPTVGARQSVLRLHILSVICLPIRRSQGTAEIFGLVYLDNRSARGVFTAETCAEIESSVELISLAAWNALERRSLRSQVEQLSRELRSEYRFDAILGHDPKIVDVLRLVAQVADSEATVLVLGESGTGKELIAKAIHYNSRRRLRPFVPLNCGALPENLLDAELFGHMRGAFTGAVADTPGWFERAAGGTIFLDEVGEMTPSLQVKMLRVLESGEYSRVGSTTVRRSDARVVAATNRDLGEQVREGKMRQDLLYRLNVLEVTVPPLRERRSDILLLARHFLDRFNAKHDKDRQLSLRTEDLLLAHDYPGNVRELQNAIQRAVLVARGAEIEPIDLPESLRVSALGALAAITAITAGGGRDKSGAPGGFRAAKRRVIEEFEREYLHRCLRGAEGNISEAARTAGIDFKNFHAKMTRYGIDPGAFKRARAAGGKP